MGTVLYKQYREAWKRRLKEKGEEVERKKEVVNHVVEVDVYLDSIVHNL